jgi:hypothetical protein
MLTLTDTKDDSSESESSSQGTAVDQPGDEHGRETSHPALAVHSFDLEPSGKYR